MICLANACGQEISLAGLKSKGRLHFSLLSVHIMLIFTDIRNQPSLLFTISSMVHPCS